MKEKQATQINLEEIIKSKNPKLAKYLPNFFLKLIKKIVHLDELNSILYQYKDKHGIEMVHSIIKYFNLNIEYYGLEKIDKNKAYIFAANHPLGSLEGQSLISIVDQHFGELKFIANDILLYLKNYEPLLLPVNKHGAFSKDYAKLTNEAYSSNKQILVFPAGLVSRRVKGKIVDSEWKKNFISKAKEFNRDVIPVYVDARNSNFFYNFSNLRKFLGIKANIEMFFLPSELFKQKNITLKFYFGEPISYKKFDKSKKPKEWAAFVKDIVFNLRE